MPQKYPGPEDHRPQKRLGQHFLVDKNIRDKIIAACGFTPQDTVLEIGPGRGALTSEIAGRVAQFYAIEKDRRLYEYLKDRLPPGEQIHLVRGDFLACNLNELPFFTKIIGNLPYNISSPIIVKLLQNRQRFGQLFFTVQYEFAERLAAKVNTREYGALTCFVQYYSEVRPLFPIKNTAFRPVPKVKSSLVNLTPKSVLDGAKDEDLLFAITRKAFQQRRKVIYNALAGVMDKSELGRMFADLNLERKARPENLSLADYIRISNYIKDLGQY